MKKILVAGASGALGKEILEELNERGLKADALVRDVAKLGEHHSFAENVHVADARDAASLKGVCDGVDAVISTVGASLQLGFTKDKSTFFDTDHKANKNLLDEALSAGVKKFVYVSMCNGNTTLKGVVYADAHEAFAGDLKQSGIDYAVIRPTGFFYLFDEILKQAKRGRAMLIGDGSARTNPVHERDVAIACIDALTSNEKEISIGGPDIFTRREIVEICFEVLGKKAKISSLPAGLMSATVFPVKLFDRRLYDLLDFGIAVFTNEIVAPQTGKFHFRDYIKNLASNNSSGK
jgi:uncharacterized protein YbjT (DUF2867 family)